MAIIRRRTQILYAFLFLMIFVVGRWQHLYAQGPNSINHEAINTIVTTVKEEGVDFIDLDFTDLNGELKTYTITKTILSKTLEKGVFFDGSSVAGYTTLSQSDLQLKPDLTTFVIMPHDGSTYKKARIFCDVYAINGKPYPLYPRNILKKTMAQAKEKGLCFVTSPEIEFFIFRKHDERLWSDRSDRVVHTDQKDYCAAFPNRAAGDVILSILDALEKVGLKPEKTHHEVAPSQHEITLRYGNALTIADNFVLAKKVMKNIADAAGYIITFMPKPVTGINGSGMHLNYSLFDNDLKQNLFCDPEGEYFLSSKARAFIAGNLMYIRDMCAIFNPTINSYKRLIPGYEAPVYIGWGPENRSTLIRIPHVDSGEFDSVRAELRLPDASNDIYLATAVLLKSGLEGIEKEMVLCDAVKENLFKLSSQQLQKKNIDIIPTTLSSALDCLEESDFMKTFLGKGFHKRYVALKRDEVKEFDTAVTDWELARYLSV